MLYAARFVGDGTAATGGSGGCLLKEHPPRTRDIAIRELSAYTALMKPAALATAAAAEAGGKAGGAVPLLYFSEFDIRPSSGGVAALYEPPLAPVVGACRFALSCRSGAATLSGHRTGQRADSACASLPGYFEGGSGVPTDDFNKRLWVVQRWEGLRTVSRYPEQAAQKRAAEAAKSSPR